MWCSALRAGSLPPAFDRLVRRAIFAQTDGVVVYTITGAVSSTLPYALRYGHDELNIWEGGGVRQENHRAGQRYRWR